MLLHQNRVFSSLHFITTINNSLPYVPSEEINKNLQERERMGPANKQWIRSRMAGIKKASGIAFSEEIFLSILICLIAKNKHLVLHTFPEAVTELKSVVEQVQPSPCTRQQTFFQRLEAQVSQHELLKKTPTVFLFGSYGMENYT